MLRVILLHYVDFCAHPLGSWSILCGQAPSSQPFGPFEAGDVKTKKDVPVLIVTRPVNMHTYNRWKYLIMETKTTPIMFNMKGYGRRIVYLYDS